MIYTTLRGTNLQPSVLGFGCAPILGRVAKKQSLRALNVAYNSGITHFDIARSYGFGEAEGLLGKFIQGKRDKLYIATKFGIAPSQQTQMLNKLKPLVRTVLALAPGSRTIVRQQVSHLTIRSNFSVDAAKTSLEKSLRQLRTDYVDILFLHECTSESLLDEELFNFLDDCVRDGKVRYYGIATGINETIKILNETKASIKVTQFPSSLFDRNAEELRKANNIAFISHSPFGGMSGLNRIRFLINKNPELLSNWSHLLDVEKLDFSKLIALILQYSIKALGNDGVVLCSMFQEEHILANVNSVNLPTYSNNQISKFAQIIENLK